MGRSKETNAGGSREAENDAVHDLKTIETLGFSKGMENSSKIILLAPALMAANTRRQVDDRTLKIEGDSAVDWLPMVWSTSKHKVMPVAEVAAIIRVKLRRSLQ